MCRPPSEKIDWEKEHPELLPPPADGLDQANLPQLEMIPFVSVEVLGEALSDNENSMDIQYGSSMSSEPDDEEDKSSPMALPSVTDEPAKTEDEETNGPLVISFCMNDPKIVWPSSESSSSGSGNDTDNDSVTMEEISGVTQNQCLACGDSVEAGGTVVSTGTGHSCPVWFQDRGRGFRGSRGRNFARRSRPFFGEQKGLYSDYYIVFFKKNFCYFVFIMAEEKIFYY